MQDNQGGPSRRDIPNPPPNSHPLALLDFCPNASGTYHQRNIGSISRLVPVSSAAYSSGRLTDAPQDSQRPYLRGRRGVLDDFELKEFTVLDDGVEPQLSVLSLNGLDTSHTMEV